MIDKGTIKRSFSKAAGTYDAHSGLQKEVAVSLARRIVEYIHGCAVATGPACAQNAAASALHGRSKTSISVLDVGCGTGHVIEALCRALPDARICGSDISLEMLGRARRKCGTARLAVSDCEALPFANGGFDVIASSLAYQWSTDLRASFGEAARILKPGGLLAFSTLGPSTLRELYGCMESIGGYSAPVKLKGAGELRALVQGAGLEPVSMDNDCITRVYPQIGGLVRTLKKIGASPHRALKGEGLSFGAFLKEAGRLYLERHPAPDGAGIVATYDVTYLLARKG